MRGLLAALVLLGCGGATEPVGPAGYLALGDSYTIGESVPAEARWPVRLRAALARGGLAFPAPRIIARTGWSTRQMLAAIDAAAPQGPFGLVTLQIGVNDQFRGGDAGRYRPDFRAALDRAVALAGSPCRVAVISIPDYGQTPFGAGEAQRIGAAIDAFNAVARDESRARGVAWIDITDISRRGRAEPALVAGDGLHPSGAQYAEWAARIAPVINPALRACRR